MKKYPKYKDSGIEWIGEIPEHWDKIRVKFTDEVIMGQSPNSDDYNDTESGLPFLQGNADFTSLYPVPRIWCETASKQAKKDDVLLSVRAPVGAVNMADCEYGIGRGLCAIRSIDTYHKFLYYISVSINDELNSIATGSTYVAVTADEVRNVYIPLFDIEEQQAIADYLDKKTGLIDELIEKKRRQIELLKEQRQAVINQAVTKGLDPDVEMKDSGIEWLGEIPKHWVKTYIKYISSKQKDAIVDGPFGSSVNVQTDYVDVGVPVVRTVNISNDGFNRNNLKFMRKEKYEELKRHSVCPNDVVFSKVGTIGNCCLFPTDIEEGILSTTGSCKISINAEKVIPMFFVYLLQTMNEHFLLLASSNVQPFLNMSTIKNVAIPLPPVGVQGEILQYIKKETGRVDNAVTKAEKQIKLLQEYRTALISEAVTGKIDVREAV